MKKLPTISVIVTVYNKEKYIANCLDSILNQTLDDFEVVLIDDGSTDSSANIYNEYAKNNSKIKIFYQKNQGHSAARNAGITHSKGKYIMWVDADDYLCNDNALEMMYKEIVVNKRDVVLTNFTKPSHLRPVAGSGMSVLCNMIEKGYYHATMCSRLYKKELITQNNLYFKELICDDEEWTPKIFAFADNVSELDLNMYKRVRNSGSVTGKVSEYNQFRKGKDRIETARSLLEFFGSYNFELKKHKNIMVRHSLSLYGGGLSFYKQLKDDKYKKDLWRVIHQNRSLLNFAKYQKNNKYKFLRLLDKVGLFKAIK